MQDKRSLVNSEKKLKAIKMELESIEHMQMTQAKPAIDGGVDRTSNVVATNCNTSLASSSSVSTPSPNSAAVVVVNEADPHAAMSSILEQYIDPNILRILHKVDSQFSISNAINLSSTMKRWLHSCHSINTSVDIRVVLEEYVPLMKKVCAVLQCDHAAVFVQLSNPRKLICRCTNAGEANNVEVPCDKGIVSHVLKSGTPCNIAHAYDDPRFYSPQDNSTGITTKDVMCVPIFDHKNDAIAVLRLETVLETSHTKLLRLHDMPRQLALEAVPHVDNVSLIRFALATERQFHQILGVTKFKMFLIDPPNDDIHVTTSTSTTSSNSTTAGGLMWCVGKTLDSSCDTTFFRQYYKLSSGLCGLAIYHPKGLTIPDPLTHAKYNGAIDLTNAGHGLYIVPILSLWGKPLGVLQVGRTVVPLAKGGPKVEMLEKQAANHALKLHLIALFAQSIAGILHDLMAHEMLIKCPDEGPLADMTADPSTPSSSWRLLADDVDEQWGEVHNVDKGTGEYVADPSLPPGWFAIAHGDHVYYENPHSGEQTWIKPTC
ncbi:hypothetical protein DYB35_009704 [Aphanomyces astaci]|uniref:WW domain-containing protein n=1 Tax=Aphanomyces astaci TaxID=112090 RepID=A0A3R6XR29_APHAT|nr:hypothetical protein DYB35_009704 [Aphanomyces astaci]